MLRNSTLTNEMVFEFAKDLGFELVGFARADLLTDEVAKLKEWLKNNYHAGMAYMERNIDKKNDVTLILQNAKSVISLGMNYFVPQDFKLSKGEAKVSRYAWGKDYHFIIKEKLESLINNLKNIEPRFEGIGYVDSGPLMDKVWGFKAGLGWIGKNSNLINKNFGSYFFIANVITNFEFKYNFPEPDHCGNCTACMEACPTKAIVSPKIIDSNKCISYLTIENKGEIPGSFKNKFSGWIFGCDICQEVCPWNKKFSRPTVVKEFYNTPNKTLRLEDFREMSNGQFKARFAQSPIKRAKLKGMRRNALFLLE